MKLWNIWYQTVSKQSNLVNIIEKNKTKISPEVYSKCTTSVKKRWKIKPTANWWGPKFTSGNIFMINNLDLS